MDDFRTAPGRRSSCGWRPVLASLLLILGIGPVTPYPSWARGGTDITVNGSDTMVILMKRWAHAYSAFNPGVSIQVTGGGTGTGMAALVNRTTDICMASRPIRTDELEAAIKAFRRRPAHYAVALDALVVFVNDANSIRELSLADVAGLFGGRILNWAALGGSPRPVVLYSRENSSGTYEFFKQRVLDGRDFAPQTQTMPGTAAVIAAVARDRYGIGYGGFSHGAGVRHLAIRPAQGGTPVPPTPESVSAGEYPIWRHLQLYVNPALDRGAVADFIHWIRSKAGQAIVDEAGFLPLPP